MSALFQLEQSWRMGWILGSYSHADVAQVSPYKHSLIPEQEDGAKTLRLSYLVWNFLIMCFCVVSFLFSFVFGKLYKEKLLPILS